MKERIVVCPGSFDPVHLGHIEVFRRTAEIFDRVIVLVMQNAKKKSVFSPEERCRIIKESLSGPENISVVTSNGICADIARELGATAIVKGIRNSADFDYEADIAIINRGLWAPETIFIPAAPAYRHVSTSTALHLYSLGVDVSGYLPPAAIEALKKSDYLKNR